MDTLPDKGADISAFTGTIWHAEALNLLSRLPDASIDLLLTDFPYNTLQHLEWDKQAIDLQSFWNDANRVIKPNAAMISTASQPFTSILVMSNLKQFRHEWIWEKSQGTGYLNANRMPMKNHESIIVFSQKSPRYYPQMTEGKPYSATRGAVGGFVQDKTVGGYLTANNGFRYPLSVIKFDSDTGIHPTQKSLALFEYLTLSYSLEDDIILDPFCGSGTTAIAARNLNRHFICGDITQDYVEMARLRLNNTDPYRDKLLPDGSKQLSLFSDEGD